MEDQSSESENSVKVFGKSPRQDSSEKKKSDRDMPMELFHFKTLAPEKKNTQWTKKREKEIKQQKAFNSKLKVVELRSSNFEKDAIREGMGPFHTTFSKNTILSGILGANTIDFKDFEVMLEKKRQNMKAVKTLIKVLPVGVAIVSSNWGFSFVNRSIYNIFNARRTFDLKNKLFSLVNIDNLGDLSSAMSPQMDVLSQRQQSSDLGKEDNLYDKGLDEVRENEMLVSQEKEIKKGTIFKTFSLRKCENTLKDQMAMLFDEAIIRDLMGGKGEFQYDDKILKEKLNSKNSGSSKKDNRFFKAIFHASTSEIKILKIQMTPMIYSKEPMIGLMVRDVTQEKTIARLSAELESKTRVLANVSHELRTPLHGIMNFLSMAMESARDLKRQTRAAETIIDEYLEPAYLNTKRLSHLVGSYLDLSQLRAGKKNILNKEQFSLKECLRDCLKLIHLPAKLKGLELYLRYDSSLPLKITSDKNRLSQIVINLLGNAMKFTQKGSITINVLKHPGSQRDIQICVIDTGKGIRDEDKTKLFREFGKIDHGDNPNGIGLGLMISNQLAMLLSNSSDGLQLKTALDKGTEFAFWIHNAIPLHSDINDDKSEGNVEEYSEINAEFDPTPFKLMQNLSTFSANQPNKFISFTNDAFSDKISPKHSLTRKRFLSCKLCTQIFYVDDEPLNLKTFEIQISKLNYKLETASSKKAAIEKIKQKRTAPCKNCHLDYYPLIFMDCNLDNGNSGVQFAREILAGNYSDGCPLPCLVVACTGFSGEEVAKQIQRNEVVEVLRKPFTHLDLSKTIGKLFEKLQGENNDTLQIT